MEEGRRDTAKETGPTPNPIRHVFLLMFENGSFDRYLGALADEIPGLDGVPPDGPSRFNIDTDGKRYDQRVTRDTQLFLDPMHEHANVMTQLASGNSGFVRDFSTKYPTSTSIERQQIMDYFEKGFLPAHHALARAFRPCDAWYSSVPGNTWSNRFFALSGQTQGLVIMPGDPAVGNFLKTLRMLYSETQATILSRLIEAKRSFRVYYHDFPSSLVLLQHLRPEIRENYVSFDRFATDMAGDEKAIPDFIFIEPRYYGINQNDDHPPHNVMKAQRLIADVYNSIRSKGALWNSSLLVVTHDEHGGKYDHVMPPSAVPPRPLQPGDEYTFDQLGVRVPTLLVSPWVKSGVEKTTFDHCSLLKYLQDKWTLGDLGARVAKANSIAVAFDFSMPPRSDTPEKIEVPDMPSPRPDLEANPNPHHFALDLFVGLIKDDGGTEIARALAEDGPSKIPIKRRIVQVLIGLGVRIIIDWIRGFFEDEKAKAARDANRRAAQHARIAETLGPKSKP